MQVNIDQTRWWQRIYAAFIFYTRMPLRHWYEPPKECYRSVVEHWPLVGWLTGATMAAVLYFGSAVTPWSITVVAAILLRLLLTGALHEDGLAHFCDGFGGGGNDRERILQIMKDPHIGTYGVLGLLFYFVLLFGCLLSLTPFQAALAVLAGDAYSKMVSAQIIMFLPYAHTESAATNEATFRKMSIPAGALLFVEGVLPMLPLFFYYGFDSMLIFAPCIVMYFLYYMMNRKIHGYTNDCCSALFLLVELSFYLTLIII